MCTTPLLCQEGKNLIVTQVRGHCTAFSKKKRKKTWKYSQNFLPSNHLLLYYCYICRHDNGEIKDDGNHNDHDHEDDEEQGILRLQIIPINDDRPAIKDSKMVRINLFIKLLLNNN